MKIKTKTKLNIEVPKLQDPPKLSSYKTVLATEFLPVGISAVSSRHVKIPHLLNTILHFRNLIYLKMLRQSISNSHEK